jgi:hypothetical protein
VHSSWGFDGWGCLSLIRIRVWDDGLLKSQDAPKLVLKIGSILKKYGLIIYISKTVFSCLFNNKTNTLDGGTLYTKD